MSAEDDIRAIQDWQQNRNPQQFVDLMKRYRPVVNSVVNRYSTVGVAPATLRAQADAQLIRSLDTYDASKGAQPTTHIWNGLQKVQRIATESQISGHIPEHRNMKKSTFNTVKQNMEDRMGYEPNVDELADELKWDRKEVGRMLHEVKGETTASKAEFDFYGNTVQDNTDKPLVDYMYHELGGKDKVIFEHTFGYGGKEILNNKDIAKRLNVNEMFVHRAKKKMGKKIKEMR